MIALLQRVTQASVEVAGERVGAIDHGLLLFVCAEPADNIAIADRLVGKVLKMRVFADAAGKMNRDLGAVGGGLLVISQFTLAADTSSGNRPGFSAAAGPDLGRQLYERVVASASRLHPIVAAGRYGAEMKVSLINDGPVTIPMTVR